MANKVKLRLAKEARDASDQAYRNYLRACAAAAQKARDYLAEHVAQRKAFEAAALAAGLGEVTEQYMRERKAEMLKDLLPLERALIAPFMAAGLGGDALHRWVESGMSSTEQQHADELQAEIALASAPKPVREAKVEPDIEEGEPTFSATQIARKIDADPREFRAMLRKRGLVKSSYTLADAKIMRRAWRVEQS